MADLLVVADLTVVVRWGDGWLGLTGWGSFWLLVIVLSIGSAGRRG